MELLRNNRRIEFVSGEASVSAKTLTVNGEKKTEQADTTEASIQTIICAAPRSMQPELKRILNSNSELIVEELRFRVGKPLELITQGGEIMLPQLGTFVETDAEHMLNTFCGNSIYSKLNELNNGFITLPGGARVGICGAPVMERGSILRFTSISSFNIRIPRELKGCAEKSMRLLVENGEPISSIIASSPGVGKTTFLRDCARCFSDGCAGITPVKVAVADERGELTGGRSDALDIGARTDAIIGVPKLISIPMLIRNMSPRVIITDELAGRAEAELITETAKCGVSVIASVHAGSIGDVQKKKELSELAENGQMRMFILERRKGEAILNSVYTNSEAER